MSDSRLPMAKPEVVLREESDDWAILFDPDTAEAVGIDPVGVEVWRLLDGRHRIDEIAAAIGELFDGVPATVGDDIEAFVTDLGSRGFVSFASDGEPP